VLPERVKKAMAKKLILMFLFVALLGGAAFWYWSGTPQYSVWQLSNAVRQHDGLAFRNYFNVDAVSTRAVDDLLSETVREIGGAGLLQKLVGATVMRFFKPELSESLSRKIIDYVENPPDPNKNKSTENNSSADGANEASPSSDSSVKGEGPLERAVTGFVHKIAEAIKPPSLREVLHSMGINKDNFKGFTEFQVSGNLCRVGMKFQPPERPQIIVMLELEKKDNHWQVVRFANLDELARIASGI
jgi:hypothetical protein